MTALGTSAPLAAGRTRRAALLPYGIALAILALDQAGKALAARWLLPLGAEGLSVAGGWLRLRYLENTGAAFGLLRGQGPLLTGLALLIVGLLLAYYRLLPRPTPAARLSLGLLLGGALGNLLDRLRLGYVVDYIDLTVWPIFNLADAAICAGVAILAVHLLLEGREDPRRRPQGHEEDTMVDDGASGNRAADNAAIAASRMGASGNRRP